MTHTYTDPDTVHIPAQDAVVPTAWLQTVADNQTFLADPPACSAFNPDPQTIANSTFTVLDAPGENYDTDAMHSTVTNNSRITAQTAGLYLAKATVEFRGFSGADNHRCILRFLLNGTTTVESDVRRLHESPTVVRVSVVRMVRLAATEFVEVQVNQNPGTSEDVVLDEFALLWKGLLP